MLTLDSLPSLRKQHLLSELFVLARPSIRPSPLSDLHVVSAGLKQACPEGIFVTITPGDPTLWSAVLFVRDGETPTGGGFCCNPVGRLT